VSFHHAGISVTPGKAVRSAQVLASMLVE